MPRLVGAPYNKGGNATSPKWVIFWGRMLTAYCSLLLTESAATRSMRWTVRQYSPSLLMPTLMPTGATPDGTRRTYRFSRDGQTGLFTASCGRHGTTQTQSYATENH